MVNSHAAQIWLGRLAFAASAFVLLFLDLVPLGFSPGLVPVPDLLLGLTFAFILRRPDFVPVWLLAVVFLLLDILLIRPPGLWTAIVILTCEFTRAQEYRLRELAFVFEWVLVATMIFLAVLTNRVVLSLTMVPMPRLSADILQYLATILAYPAVVFVCYFLLRIRKITPDEAIRFGHRL